MNKTKKISAQNLTVGMVICHTAFGNITIDEVEDIFRRQGRKFDVRVVADNHIMYFANDRMVEVTK